MYLVEIQKDGENIRWRNRKIELRDGHFINYKNYKGYKSHFKAFFQGSWDLVKVIIKLF